MYADGGDYDDSAAVSQTINGVTAYTAPGAGGDSKIISACCSFSGEQGRNEDFFSC